MFAVVKVSRLKVGCKNSEYLIPMNNTQCTVYVIYVNILKNQTSLRGGSYDMIPKYLYICNKIYEYYVITIC